MRRAPVVVLLAAAGAVVTAPALAAFAATPNPDVSVGGKSVVGTTVTAESCLTIKASYGLDTQEAVLTLSFPVAPAAKPFSRKLKTVPGPHGGGSITYPFSTDEAAWNQACDTEQAPLLPNGTYAVSITGSSTPAKVTLAIPPRVVTGVTASRHGSVVDFGWAANSEPDLTGYDIVDGSGGDVTPGGVSGSCSDGSCSASVDFGSAVAGQTRSFVVKAVRTTSPGSSSTVASADSASVSVTFPAAPAPSSPSPSSPTTTGTIAGSKPSSTGTSTTIRSGRLAHDLQAYLPTHVFTRPPALPSLPPAVALPGTQEPTSDGTYNPRLAYPARPATTTTTTTRTDEPQSISSEVAHVVNVPQLWRGLAASAVLLLAAVHLRSLVTRVDLDER